MFWAKCIQFSDFWKDCTRVKKKKEKIVAKFFNLNVNTSKAKDVIYCNVYLVFFFIMGTQFVQMK